MNIYVFFHCIINKLNNANSNEISYKAEKSNMAAKSIYSFENSAFCVFILEKIKKSSSIQFNSSLDDRHSLYIVWIYFIKLIPYKVDLHNKLLMTGNISIST